MVNVFTVVGECDNDPSRLLVLGADGHYYAYHPAQARFARVAADQTWTVFGRQASNAAMDPSLSMAEERDSVSAAAPR